MTYGSLALDGKDVFAINLDTVRPGAGWVLYAPLCGGLVRMPEGDYQADTNTVADKEEYRRLLEPEAVRHIDEFRHQSSDDLVRLSIIPTFRCNFSCVYCYSANGRNKQTMPREVLDNALDHFFSPSRTPRKDRYVSIVGGGEPLLAWEEITLPAIRRIRELEKQHGLEVQLGLTTNASLITDAIAETLVAHRVRVSVSFEVLREIQDLHRKHYEEVCRNIHRLWEHGGRPALRMTVTPHNVNRLTETVQECLRSFPFVTALNMEYVVSPAFFPGPEALEGFFTAFTDSFFVARRYGLAHGLRVNTSVHRNLEVLSDRFCSGDFCVTPAGYISGCHRFTSPAEEHFQDVAYGRVDATGTAIDKGKFAGLMSYNVHRDAKCAACPAKWHCGGTCLSCRFGYDAACNEVICRFKRRFLACYLDDLLHHADT